MGRRIPKSKKHKKLKFVDPCYKGPGPQNKKSRFKFNEPPVDDNEQEVPGGMEEFMDLKNKMKQNKLKRKRKKKAYKDDFLIVQNEVQDKKEPGMEKEMKKLPKVLKQRRNENERDFLNRLQKMADTAIAEAKVEEKYNIQLVNVDKDGNAQYRSEEARRLGERKKEKRKKYKEKILAKKRLKTNNEEFELKKDDIKFGEVVTAPPMLSAKPRNAPLKNDRNSLQSGPKSIKLKDLSLDKRKELENERSRAVQMYRLLKNKKALQ